MIEELFAIQDIYNLYQNNQLIVMLSIMLVAFYPVLFIIKRFVSSSINKLVTSKKINNDILDEHGFHKRLIHLFISVYLIFCGDIFDKSLFSNDIAIRIKDVCIYSYLIISIAAFCITAISITVTLYKTTVSSRRIAIGLHAQIIKIIITICAVLSLISVMLGISVSSLFQSLGAAAALLTFVFKDTVLGLLASLQLTFQNIIKVGDWVTVPSYNADGDIEKITITVVVIRNFDKTITTIPTAAFLTNAVQNWSAMFEKGGRRIKRAINLDMDTIKICTQIELDNIKDLNCMTEFAKENVDLFDSANETTNASMFRCYVNQYLRSHQNIHQEKFTFIIRQLQPTSFGLPIEIYVFTNNTNWADYEDIQSGIFDHLLGSLSKFKLRSFQRATNTLKEK